MKGLVAFAMVLALGATAYAKPTPLELRPVALSAEGTIIDIGSPSATRESDYFRATQQPYAASRVFPCRLQLRMFDKTRLAQSCN